MKKEKLKSTFFKFPKFPFPKFADVSKEFQTFVLKGSMIDLAVGVVVGAAFTAIVNSIVKDIVSPIVGMFFGGVDFAKLTLVLPSFFVEHGVAPVLKYGSFLEAIINFLVIATGVFFFVKAINALKIKAEVAEPPKPKTPELEALEQILAVLQNTQNQRNLQNQQDTQDKLE